MTKSFRKDRDWRNIDRESAEVEECSTHVRRPYCVRVLPHRIQVNPQDEEC